MVWKHLPLSMHAKAPEAHAASEAAHRQGKFWEMHDVIFAETDWKESNAETYLRYAQNLGLDVERFRTDFTSDAVKGRVEGDTAEATRLGVRGTPAFFVNGRFLSGAQPFANFKKIIDEELAR